MYTFKKNRFLLLSLISIVLLLAGCGTVGKTLKLETNLKLIFDIASDTNPDESNTASPIFVRFYELKSPRTFLKAEFIDLYERDKEVLGTDLLAKQELKRLTPGEKREQKFVLNPQTRYIALFAEFYRYKNSKYGVIVPVRANNVFRDKARIIMSDNKIHVLD